MIINTKKETTRADVFKTFIKDNRSRWPNICTVQGSPYRKNTNKIWKISDRTGPGLIKFRKSPWIPGTVFEGYFKSGSMIDVMKAYYNPLMTFTPNEKQLCLMELWGFDKDEMMSKASFILDGLRQERRKNSCLAG